MTVLQYIIRSLLTLSLFVGFIGSVLCQSYCQQDFKFLFHDKNTNSFWIGLNLYGDQCELSKALQVTMKDGRVEVSEHQMESFDNWDGVLPFKEKGIVDYVVSLERSNKGWDYPVVQLKLRKPSYNAKLLNFYVEELNAVCGRGWNNAMGVNGTDLPKVTATKTPHLIYSHPTGLYFNYEISKAYYFPDTQYLLIFTAQSTRCVGGGSMHGFMVFKFQ